MLTVSAKNEKINDPWITILSFTGNIYTQKKVLKREFIEGEIISTQKLISSCHQLMAVPPTQVVQVIITQCAVCKISQSIKHFYNYIK